MTNSTEFIKNESDARIRMIACLRAWASRIENGEKVSCVLAAIPLEEDEPLICIGGPTLIDAFSLSLQAAANFGKHLPEDIRNGITRRLFSKD